MTPNQFLEKTAAYYGAELPEMAHKLTAQYLEEYEPGNLPALLGIVLKAHPSNYGVPDIAAIEKAHEYYYRGDARNNVEGHSSLKRRKAHATKPVEPTEPAATEDEVKEIIGGMKDGAAKLLKAFTEER